MSFGRSPSSYSTAQSFAVGRMGDEGGDLQAGGGQFNAGAVSRLLSFFSFGRLPSKAAPQALAGKRVLQRSYNAALWMVGLTYG